MSAAVQLVRRLLEDGDEAKDFLLQSRPTWATEALELLNGCTGKDYRFIRPEIGQDVTVERVFLVDASGTPAWVVYRDKDALRSDAFKYVYAALSDPLRSKSLPPEFVHEYIDFERLEALLGQEVPALNLRTREEIVAFYDRYAAPTVEMLRDAPLSPEALQSAAKALADDNALSLAGDRIEQLDNGSLVVPFRTVPDTTAAQFFAEVQEVETP